MKLCVIGCGSMSTYVHGPSYVKYREENPGFCTAACCDLRLELAEKYAERFGFARAYTDFEKMIETEKPDAVCVIVTETAAAHVGARVLKSGVPMLIEKPPGKNTEELRVLCEAASEKHTPNLVAFNRRFMPVIIGAKKRAELWGQPILSVHYSMYRVGRNDEDFSDTAIHAIDAARFLAGGDYAHVNFTRREIPGKRPKIVLMDAVMSNGVLVCIRILPDSGMSMERAEIHSDGGAIYVGLPTNDDNTDRFGWLEEYERDMLISRADCAYTEAERFIACGFHDENAFFFDRVRDGTLDSSALSEAMNSMLVKEAYAKGEIMYENCEDNQS